MISNILLIYAAILLVGGWFGYSRAGSLVSLIASVTAAGSILTSAFLLKTNLNAERFSLFIITILLIFFGVRWWWTLRFLPSGLMTIVTALTFGLLLYRFLTKREGETL